MTQETALTLARKAAQHLQEKGIEQGRLEAELLLSAVLGIKRLELYMQFDRPVLPEELDRFRGFVRRRLKREPLQYILGQVTFRHLELRVDQRVLIPRPETELLVDQVLRWAQEHGARRALDIGTGSGAIALSLARESALSVVATDLSPDALAVAQANAERLGLLGQVEFRQGAVWQPVAGERFDVVVSNPPYIAESERAQLAPEVRDWEPSGALFSGHAGMGVIENIAQGAAAHLAAGGLLALEIGAAQALEVVQLIDQTNEFAAPVVVRDLAGRDRIVLAELAH